MISPIKVGRLSKPKAVYSTWLSINMANTEKHRNEFTWNLTFMLFRILSGSWKYQNLLFAKKSLAWKFVFLFPWKNISTQALGTHWIPFWTLLMSTQNMFLQRNKKNICLATPLTWSFDNFAPGNAVISSYHWGIWDKLGKVLLKPWMNCPLLRCT